MSELFPNNIIVDSMLSIKDLIPTDHLPQILSIFDIKFITINIGGIAGSTFDFSPEFVPQTELDILTISSIIKTISTHGGVKKDY